MRLPGTPISDASCRALMLSGIKNSSRSISPGCVLTRTTVQAPSVIVDNLDIFWSICSPVETNSPAFVYTDTPLPIAVAAQLLKPVSWWKAQHLNADGSIQKIQLPASCRSNRLPLRMNFSIHEKHFCGAALERADHDGPRTIFSNDKRVSSARSLKTGKTGKTGKQMGSPIRVTYHEPLSPSTGSLQ
jgi:hypothetical protein